jgi:hypothetical protein
MFGKTPMDEPIPHAMAIVLVFYFLPAFVAFVRGLKKKVLVTVLNLLLGFTGIGWVALLLYASLANNGRDQFV